MKKTRDRKYPADRIAMLSVLALSANQLGYPAVVSAEELSYEGTTQMPTEDYSLDVDTFAVELTVEEVYAEAGNTLSAGDKILKLTDDSYQDALDYYEAAVIRADNTLTDTQLEYDQGVLDAKYEYETAETKADQAEFIKEYQTEELADTIADHEDTADDLDDKISEVETAIANGSYSTSSSSGGSAGSSSSESAAGTDTSQETDAADGTTDQDSFTDDENSSDQNSSGQNSAGQDSSENQNSSENQDSNGEITVNPDEDGENGPDQNQENNGSETDTEQQISSLKSQIEASTEKYNEILNQLEALVNTGSGETTEGTENNTDNNNGNSTEASTGENTENGTTGGTESSTEDFTDSVSGEDSSTLAQELQNSIDGDTTIKGHMENVQKMVKNVPESVTAAASLAGIEYEKYITLLDECIKQMQTNLDAQQQVLEALNEAGVSAAAENSADNTGTTGTADSTDGKNGPSSGSDAGSGDSAVSGNSTDTETVQSLLTQLEEVNTERNSLYSQLLTVMETQLNEISGELSQLKAQSGTSDNNGNTGSSGENGTAGNTGNSGTAGTNGTAGNTGSTDGTGFPSGVTDTNGTGTNGTGTNGTNTNGTGTDTNGTGTNAAGANMSGFSIPSGSSAASGTAAGGTVAAGTSGTAAAGTSGASMSMEDLNLTEEDISLFGDTYDLTQIKNLLDQDPMDEDSAESLLDQLEEAADTVDTQYSELIRNQKATELKIQYTYDTSVLEGKLAEITYEQTLQSWEDTLQEAKDNKADLEEKKELLESMSDGVITSENGGTVAAVNYEADDTINAMTPIVSYYDTSVVTVTISVPQDEIAEFKVGDSVDVTLSGIQNLTGTIAEKSLEASDGTSRTEVDYEVKISLDNSEGFLSSGMSAEISLDTEEVSEEAGNE